MRNNVNCTTSYLMGVDGYICRKRSSVYEYYLKDAHGDVMYAMNQIGGRVSQYGYSAWGEGTTDYSYYSGINQTPIRYSGQYYDYESGMTYLRARYYDSEIKRFTTEDPAKDGLNWYAYCGNNPVMRVDPTGLRSEEDADEIIKNNIQNIIIAAEKFGVNPAILAATIYAEQRLNVDWVDDITDGICGFYGIDTSIGVAQVRISTAKFLEEQGYMPLVVAEDGGWNIPGAGFVSGTENMARAKMLEDPAISIMYAAAYLKYFQDTWKSSYPEIDGRTAILATLYNLGHENTTPNPNPQPNEFGTFAKDSYQRMRTMLGLN